MAFVKMLGFNWVVVFILSRTRFFSRGGYRPPGMAGSLDLRMLQAARP